MMPPPGAHMASRTPNKTHGVSTAGKAVQSERATVALPRIFVKAAAVTIAGIALAAGGWWRLNQEADPINAGKTAAAWSCGRASGAAAPGCADAATALTQSGSGQAAPATLSVRVVSVKTERWRTSLESNGELVAVQEASITARVPGWRLKSFDVEVGQAVKAGQVLGQLDDEMAKIEAQRLEAAALEAQSGLEEAQSSARRAQQLFEQGNASAQDLERATTGLKLAQARHQGAQAALRAALLQIEHGRLVSPVDGLVVSKQAVLGAVVAPGHELARVIAGGELEWRAEIPAHALSLIQPGQSVRLTIDGQEVASGRVRLIAPAIDPRRRVAWVHACLDEQRGVSLPATFIGTASPDASAASWMRLGQWVQGQIDIGERDVLVLPSSSIQQRDGAHRVWIIDANQRVQNRPVVTGERRDAWVEILRGLTPEDRVVAQGAEFLTAGDRVEVVTSEVSAVSSDAIKTSDAPAQVATSTAP